MAKGAGFAEDKKKTRATSAMSYNGESCHWKKTPTSPVRLGALDSGAELAHRHAGAQLGKPVDARFFEIASVLDC